MSSAPWRLPLTPTVRVWPSPSTTYLVIGDPLSVVGPQVRCTVVLPAVAMTLAGALGGPIGGGAFGGRRGGVGRGSPPRVLFADFSPTLPWPFRAATRAPGRVGAVVDRRSPPTGRSSSSPALGATI